jgi:thymidylate synthase (FAD)
MKSELLSYFGNDLMVVNAARVSYGKSKEVLDEKDVKLIKFLLEHKHVAPFRHPQLQFRIQCPIFVERQLFKHQIGMSANSLSGRYVDFSDSYYHITYLRKQSKSSKQGSDGLLDRPDLLEKMDEHIKKSQELYKELCDAGVAKEQCRVILPLSLETTFIWTGSLLAFLHLWELRLKLDVQEETRMVANEMLTLVKNIEGNPFKYTLEAFGLSDGLSDKEIKTSVEEEKIVEHIEELEINEINELGLSTCRDCEETTWDGRLCHSCGAKDI